MEPGSEMQFGQLIQPELPVGRRPDEEGTRAVRRCGTIPSNDLPVFLDLDVLLDMVAHATSNVRVELGGVLLGGQYLDGEGKPFVVVTHGLRAEHYQATRGSFKFTHETWEAITRQRANLPQETRMIGWYHTHPDWGVFLSSMDLFICEHFFDKPLDVAIVLDPIREERGIFYWDQSPERRMAQASGFYLTSSRLTHEELQREVIPWGTELAWSPPSSLDSDFEGNENEVDVKATLPPIREQPPENIDPS